VAEFALSALRVLMHAVFALRGSYSVGRFVATRKNVLAEDLDIRLFVTYAHPVCTLVIVLASILRQMTKIAATVATLAVGMAQTVHASIRAVFAQMDSRFAARSGVVVLEKFAGGPPAFCGPI
jgi:small-conductance mechanosensitive channel